MNDCRWCGETHAKGKCPNVKAIEFFENGEVKRVEYLTPQDMMPVNGWPQQPAMFPAVQVPNVQPFYPNTIITTTKGSIA